MYYQNQWHTHNKKQTHHRFFRFALHSSRRAYNGRINEKRALARVRAANTNSISTDKRASAVPRSFQDAQLEFIISLILTEKYTSLVIHYSHVCYNLLLNDVFLVALSRPLCSLSLPQSILLYLSLSLSGSPDFEAKGQTRIHVIHLFCANFCLGLEISSCVQCLLEHFSSIQRCLPLQLVSNFVFVYVFSCLSLCPLHVVYFSIGPLVLISLRERTISKRALRAHTQHNDNCI